VLVGRRVLRVCALARSQVCGTPCGVFLHGIQNRVMGFSLACVIRVAQLTGLNGPVSPLQHDTSAIGAAVRAHLTAVTTPQDQGM